MHIIRILSGLFVVQFALFAAANPIPGAGIQASILDSAGNMWVTGYVIDGSYPATPGALQPMFGGGACGTSRIPPNPPLICTDAFVAKLDPTGKLLYFTYLGGSSDDDGAAIAVDGADNIYVAGFTDSPNFPTTSGAYQRQNAHAGQTSHGDSQAPVPGGNFFVLKLTPAGSLIFSTLVGGSATDPYDMHMSVDPLGNAYVSGFTSTSDFPIVPGAYMPSGASQFVFKLNDSGNQLLYSTYFDGNVHAIQADSSGNLYLTGTAAEAFKTTPGVFQPLNGGGDDAFVAALNPSGSGVLFATFLGGSGVDVPHAIAVDSEGDIWITGGTASPNFPLANPYPSKLKVTCPGTSAAGPYELGPCDPSFVSKLSPDGTKLLFSTYFGVGNGYYLKLDPAGNLSVVGSGTSDFPTTLNGMLTGPCGNLFLTNFNSTGGVISSSHLPANLGGIFAVAIDSAGRIHVVSDETYSLIDPGDTRMSIACVLNGASFLTGGILPAVGIAPGEIVSLFGSALGPDQPAGSEFDANGNVSNSVAGVQVLFDGQAAPLLYVQAKQINAVVPFEIASSTTTHIEVEYHGSRTPAIEMPVNEAVPGVFTLDSSGYGPAAVLNEDGTINSPSNPAKKGSVIMIYATGAGLTNPSAVDGKLAIGELPKPRLPVSVRFTEPIDADIVYAGAAPGFVAGAVQINARIPVQTHSGTGVPITLIIGQAFSEGLATIAVE